MHAQVNVFDGKDGSKGNGIWEVLHTKQQISCVMKMAYFPSRAIYSCNQMSDQIVEAISGGHLQ